MLYNGVFGCHGNTCYVIKPRLHQSRTQHGPSRITSEHPGPRDASIRGEPGRKCFDGPSTDDGRSKNIVNPDPTRQHYGWTRSQHGWPRTTTAALRTVPDRPTPDHAGPNTVSTRMIPDRPGPSRMRYGLSRTAPNPTRTAQDSPVSEAFLHQQSCIFVYFLF